MDSTLENLNLKQSFDLMVEDAFGILLNLSDITAEEAAQWTPPQEPGPEAPELPFTELPCEEAAEIEIEGTFSSSIFLAGC